jgi:hypothetical protein
MKPYFWRDIPTDCETRRRAIVNLGMQLPANQDIESIVIIGDGHDSVIFGREDKSWNHGLRPFTKIHL